MKEKVVPNYREVISREILRNSPVRKNIEKFFALVQKNKDEGNDFLQGWVKLIINIRYGVQIRKDINEIYKCNSEHWMQTEYDDNVWNLGIYQTEII